MKEKYHVRDGHVVTALCPTWSQRENYYVTHPVPNWLYPCGIERPDSRTRRLHKTGTTTDLIITRTLVLTQLCTESKVYYLRDFWKIDYQWFIWQALAFFFIEKSNVSTIISANRELIFGLFHVSVEIKDWCCFWISSDWLLLGLSIKLRSLLLEYINLTF